jgi:putative colanic acid biosynthesis UDP-glucose lipid carrier transferase
MYPGSQRSYLIRLADAVTLVWVFTLVISCLYLWNYADLPVAADNIILLTMSLVCWYFSTEIVHTYRGIRGQLFSVELIKLLKTILFHTLLFSFCFLIIFPYHLYQRAFVTLYPVMAVLLLTTERYLVRSMLTRLRKKGRYGRKVLIVGAGVRALHFYETVVKEQQYGYILTGFVDDERKELPEGNYLGRVKDLEEILKLNEVDDVVIALPVVKIDLIVDVIKASERNGKRVKMLPDYGILGIAPYLRDDDMGTPVIDVRSYPLDRVEYRLMKRSFDLVFSSLVILLLLSWSFPLIALLIRLESKGPVFFKQLRTGLNNQNFWCLKFRSMSVNDQADQVSASRNDSRITKTGVFLRKTSLDELPQFLNVFMGNMSVVGPRPHMVKHHKDFSAIVDEYMLRHFVKPGITGWAQVNGYRGQISREEDIRKRVEHDLWYIENWKFDLDIQIILQTMMNIVKGEEKAY